MATSSDAVADSGVGRPTTNRPTGSIATSGSASSFTATVRDATMLWRPDVSVAMASMSRFVVARFAGTR
ncbi:hypothetical protein COSO111634_23430 [Corallococcus soli]